MKGRSHFNNSAGNKEISNRRVEEDMKMTSRRGNLKEEHWVLRFQQKSVCSPALSRYYFSPLNQINHFGAISI